MPVEAYRPTAQDASTLSAAAGRYQLAAKRLESYLNRTTVFAAEDTAITGAAGAESFKSAIEASDARERKTAISSELRQRVVGRLSQVSSYVSSIESARTATEEYAKTPRANLTPAEEAHLQTEYLRVAGELPTSVQNRLIEPKPSAVAKLAGLVRAVAEKRRMESPERVRRSAPPMEEQDRALMWGELFEMFDNRMGYDAAMARIRARERKLREKIKDIDPYGVSGIKKITSFLKKVA